MKKLFAIISLMTLVMAFTPVAAFAAGSQEATTIEPTTDDGSITENPTTDDGGKNDSPVSPKTGSTTATAFAFVLIFTGMGSAVVAKKKLSE